MKLFFLLLVRQAVNLTELANLVASQLCESFKLANGYDSVYYWPNEIWDEFVIAKSRIDGKLYKLTFTVNDKVVTFGEPVQVEEIYVEIASQGLTPQAVIQPPSEALRPPKAARAASAVNISIAGQSFRVVSENETEAQVQIAFQAKMKGKEDPKGFKWRCQVVGWGMSKTNDIWQAEVFRQSLGLWEGIDCYADHPSESELRDRPERSIHQKIGVWQNFEITSDGMDATLNIKPSATWLAEDLLWAEQNGYLHFYGFSLVAYTRAKQVEAPDGQTARLHTQIVKPMSVDAVTMDAANGHIKVALQSRRDATNKEKSSMKWQVLARLFKAQNAHFKIVRQGLIQAGAAGINAEMTEDQLAQAVCQNDTLVSQTEMLLAAADGAIEIARQTNPLPTTTTNDSGQTTPQANPATLPPAQTSQAMTVDQLPVEMRDMLVVQAYNQTGLPESTKQALRKRLGATATLAQHQQAIQDAEAIAETFQSGQDNFGFNNPRSQVTAETRDKYQIAVAKTFGLTYDEFNGIESTAGRAIRQSGGTVYRAEQDLYNSVPAIESIREFYIRVTGDRGFVGVANMPRSVRQATYTSADFPDLFLDAMHKRLLKDYRRANYMWEKVVTVKPVQDFKDQHAILMGYFSDLPAVAEGGTYQTPAALTDTKETYAISKKGRIVELTLEAIANDDLSAFTRVVNRLGIAAARTLAKFIFKTLIMDNPTLDSDSLALFHASHNNLLTDALSSTSLKAALALLQNQTEPGSNEKFGMDTRNLNLWVPTALSLDGRSLTEAQNEPGGNDDALAKTIRTLGISSITQPVFADTNDWLLTASTDELDLVEIGFFLGQREPEMFVQNNPQQGVSFESDTVMRWKIRHIYGGAPVDFRGMVKSSVVGS